MQQRLSLSQAWRDHVAKSHGDDYDQKNTINELWAAVRTNDHSKTMDRITYLTGVEQATIAI